MQKYKKMSTYAKTWECTQHINTYTGITHIGLYICIIQRRENMNCTHIRNYTHILPMCSCRYAPKHKYTYVNINTQTPSITCTCVQKYKYIHTNIYTNTFLCTFMYKHMIKHTNKDTHAYKYRHAHMRTYVYPHM